MISPENPREQKVWERFAAAGQDHIFQWWPELNAVSREKFLDQLETIDLDRISELAERFTDSQQAGTEPLRIEPAPVVSLPRTEEERAAAMRARRRGEEALRAGEVAVITVAGGQSTRLGYDGPKGTFPVGPVTGRTLFHFHAEKVLAVDRRYGAPLHWHIMTSRINDAQTRTYFEENDFFGLEPSRVHFFVQGMIPAVDLKGKLILDAKDHVFENPNGHGGTLKALQDSGGLDEMRSAGVELFSYFQVDNLLVNIADPVFIGRHLLEGAEMSSKIVRKAYPEEKVGVIGLVNGRLGVIEYSDLGKEDMFATEPDGRLRFEAGSIAIHLLSREFIEREVEGGGRLPFHRALKKIPHLDADGRPVQPESPNGIKFECFIFDALGHAARSLTMEVRREEEFAPIKNREGQDSPASARALYVSLCAEWLEKAGLPVPRTPAGEVDGDIEISPLFALDAEELAGKLSGRIKDGLSFSSPLLLE